LISIEDLSLLDIQIWVRSGEECGKRCLTAQSNVSRKNTATLKFLEARLERNAMGEWEIPGKHQLLDMERKVHQHYRFNSDNCDLRLEATAWAGPTLATAAPGNWMHGTWDHVGIERPLCLLKKGIIDAWIGSYHPDMPDKQDPDFIVIDLCRTPVYLCAAQGHPLIKKEKVVREDLDDFPSLSLPSGWFPKTEAKLRSHGLWSTPARMKKYKPEKWEGRTHDNSTLCYATCLGLEVMKNLDVINYDLELVSGESLVVRKEFVNEKQILQLLKNLQRRVMEKSRVHPDLTPCFDSTTALN
tara:strand:+ start:1288 stop:2187 length:900 start_codon:yes stop_codon:yes gene_type:complete